MSAPAMTATATAVTPASTARPKATSGMVGGRRSSKVLLDILTWLVLVVMLAPIVYLVLASLQNNLALSTGEFDLFSPTVEAFRRIWDRVDFAHFLVNSMVISA